MQKNNKQKNQKNYTNIQKKFGKYAEKFKKKERSRKM